MKQCCERYHNHDGNFERHTAVNHTPTPWTVAQPGTQGWKQLQVVRPIGNDINRKTIFGSVAAISTNRSSTDNFSDATEQANAAFIVRACNSYEALVVACKAAEEQFRNPLSTDMRAFRLVKAALALAEPEAKRLTRHEHA